MAATTAPTPRHGTRSSPARLAATETNIAYRTADHERWQQLDFIVGIEVHLSNNHTCLGKDGKPHPFYDICDELKGKYPKDFKFTGWHPHCRCIATTILKTDAEMDADDEAILRDDEPADPDTSENAVTEQPENFRGWMEANQDRIQRAKSLPYFIRDNQGMISGSGQASGGIRSGHLGGHHVHKEIKARELQNDIPMKRLNPDADTRDYTSRQAQAIGARMVEPMGYDKADKQHANPTGDMDNCQSAVVAFHARLLGMDVAAASFDAQNEFFKKLADDQTLAYYISPKNRVHPTAPRKLMSVQEVLDFIENETAKNGVYNLAINKLKRFEDGHIMCLIKHDGKAYLVDIQDGKRIDLNEELSHAEFLDPSKGKKKGVEIMRVDKLVLSDEALQVLIPVI